MILAPLPFRKFYLLSTLLLVATSPCAAQTARSNDDSSAPKILDAQIGFQGTYKLGCWTPISVELSAGDEAFDGRVIISVPDTDGVPTRVTKEIQLAQAEKITARLFVRVGQASSPIDVELESEEGKIQSKRSFYLGSRIVQGTPGGYPATNRFVLEFGATLGLDQLLQTNESSNEQLATRIARVEQADELPSQWHGYESAEVVLLATSQLELYKPLAQNLKRVEALDDWVQRGGQLILFCGSNAEELLAPEGALARFAPGKFVGMESLTQPQPLASFSGSEQINQIRRINLRVPSFVDVDGRILSSAGRSSTNVPLVVRTRRGLGEIVFVGLDFDQPPLNTWEGRSSFLRRLLGWKANDGSRQSDEQLDATDLTSHLWNSLDKQFVGVQVIPFGVVAFLAGAYILLIGPGDYFFVRRVLNRPTLTWLTFPLIVLGISVLAYVIANRMKGDQLRVNQVEIIDVDCSDDPKANSLAHGTVYTHFFTPEVSSLDLQLQTAFLGSDISENSEQLVSWLGLPGYSLGAMQASGSQTAVFDEGYDFNEDLSSLQDLPVQVWSTKTLTARWSASVAPAISINLQKDGEELIQGTITNDSGEALSDGVLLYGRWAYRVGTLPANRSIEINDSLQPRTVKTLLTNATAGDQRFNRTSEDGTVPFVTAKWDVARLLKVMMFYEAVNGSTYTNMIHRYQSFLDLSDILQQDDQAILLARCEAPGSVWKTENDELTSEEDRRWTYYRFVANVEDPKDN